jgi:hypothetical protein
MQGNAVMVIVGGTLIATYTEWNEFSAFDPSQLRVLHVGAVFYSA